MPYTGCEIKQLGMVMCFEIDSVSLKEAIVRNYLTWLGFACIQLRGSVLAWAWIIGGAEVQCSYGSSWRHHSSREFPGSIMSSGEPGYRDGGKRNPLFCLVPITYVKERAWQFILNCHKYQHVAFPLTNIFILLRAKCISVTVCKVASNGFIDLKAS